jgi:hypothetical protein
VPAGLARTDASLTAVRVGWTAADGNGRSITAYELQVDGGSTVNVGNVTTWVHGGLGPSQNHTYAIRTLTSLGASPWSATITGKTLDPPPTVVHYYETTGGATNTWTNYTNAGGSKGQTIPTRTTVEITCKLTGFAVANGNTWWYRIAQAPWSNAYYASADAFYNNGATSGSLVGTPWVDPAVPNC